MSAPGQSRPPRFGLRDFSCRASISARDRHRLVRKSTRPRLKPERDAQQCVAAFRIPDLVAIEIYELPGVVPLRCFLHWLPPATSNERICCVAPLTILQSPNA